MIYIFAVDNLPFTRLKDVSFRVHELSVAYSYESEAELGFSEDDAREILDCINVEM